jgi:hypothetical protein
VEQNRDVFETEREPAQAIVLPDGPASPSAGISPAE